MLKKTTVCRKPKNLKGELKDCTPEQMVSFRQVCMNDCGPSGMVGC
jgi:hypothetical protein